MIIISLAAEKAELALWCIKSAVICICSVIGFPALVGLARKFIADRQVDPWRVALFTGSVMALFLAFNSRLNIAHVIAVGLLVGERYLAKSGRLDGNKNDSNC